MQQSARDGASEFQRIRGDALHVATNSLPEAPEARRLLHFPGDLRQLRRASDPGVKPVPLHLVPAPETTPEANSVHVMSPRQRYVFRSLVAVWVAALASFWIWWLQADHVVTWLGMLVNSALLVWTTCLPAWCFFFVDRMKRPNAAVSLPEGRVAMIVTKAPSEPWPLVRTTLLAMLSQSFPEPRDFFLVFRRRSGDRLRTFDVWLADEDPSAETERWCAAHGVKLSSRKGITEYHNPSWPGRERCKEGNLRYFYEAMGGYANYDFVVQLDADHVPTSNYLTEMVRPFSDTRVGYVAAPSICDANASESWAARARLYAEASMHGSLQAGYSDGYAPLCIGSHYAVRTSALEQIGGLGPELAEDHTTSMMMNAAGWRGAFAIDAIAHGDGPASMADCITQEFQWSRSLANVLLACTPRNWGGLNLRGKVEFGFSQLWYPLFAGHLLLAYLVPPIALLTRTPWVDVDLFEFLAHAWVLTVCTVAPVFFIHRQGWFRPAESKLMSWEATLFQFARWPWVLLGVGQAFIGWLVHKEFNFKVTPKGRNRAQALPVAIIMPYFAMVVVQTGVAILAPDPGEARGYYFFLLMNALAYTLVIVAVTGLHLRESVRQRTGRARAWAGTMLRVLPIILVSGVLVGVTVALRGEPTLVALLPSAAERFSDSSTQRDDGSRSVADLVTAGAERVFVQLPTSVAAVVTGIVRPELVDSTAEPVRSPITLVELADDAVSIGAYDPHEKLDAGSLAFEHEYVRQDQPDVLAAVLAHTAAQRMAMVTIEPFPARGLDNLVLDRVAAGSLDAQLRKAAQVVRDHRQVVLIRWGHEMELSGLYPWSTNQPDVYSAAFRRVVAIFREEGATNARFVWSPAGNEVASAYYPGGDVVDYVGVTVLEDEEWDRSAGQPPQSFTDLFGPRYARMDQFGKPILIAELGVSGTPERQSAWLADIGPQLKYFPHLRALVYFNDVNPAVMGLSVLPDWRVDPATLGRLVADADELGSPDRHPQP